MAFNESIRAADDASAADWIAPMLGEFGTVGGLVPAGFDRYVLVGHKPFGAPGNFSLPSDLAGRLSFLLTPHTTTPDAAWFAIWEGYGFNRSEERELAQFPRFELPHRRYHLLAGGVGDAAGVIRPDAPGALGFLDLWWPDDRSWFVATDTDLPWSYVGATDAACDEIALDLPERTKTVSWVALNGTLGE